MAATHDKERQLTREIGQKVEKAIPGIEVLAVGLSSPERFTVFVDHAQGVDHALCERVTNVLRDYLREYSVDVSSPGVARPLRRPEHFRSVLGRRVAPGSGRDATQRRHRVRRRVRTQRMRWSKRRCWSWRSRRFSTTRMQHRR